MALKQKTVSLIVVVIVVGLSGLVTVQALLLKSAFDSKEQAFHRNVMAALGAATQRLTTREIMAIALVSDSNGTFSATTSLLAMDYGQDTCDSQSTGRSKLLAGCDSAAPLVWTEDDMIRYRIPRDQHINIQMVDPSTGQRRVIVDSFRTAGSYSIPMSGNGKGLQQYEWHFTGDSGTLLVQVRDDLPAEVPPPADDDSLRVRMVMSVLNRWEGAEQQPIEERLDPDELDSIVGLSLEEAGIDLDRVYGVLTADDSLFIAKPSGYDAQLRESAFRTQLFPHDLFSEQAELVVYFPERAAFLYQQMSPLVLPTAVFMLVVVGCFVYTIRTILKQRRLATLMVDFINNMTHEFKTPISTVRLAGEAISREDVIGDPNRVRQFNDMILRETQRMRNQTDKILQMALLEQGEFDLNVEPVDVHEIIGKAVESISLQVGQRQGVIECDLKAQHHVMEGDPVHLTNIVHNLLDNAAKYSPERPRIRVGTTNDNGALTVAVSDNGIGMHQDDCRHAFDRYFRVSTGNVHDVKGFGLGLSYVKLMVEAHGGTVTLRSRPGQGTRVEMTFPESRLGA